MHDETPRTTDRRHPIRQPIAETRVQRRFFLCIRSHHCPGGDAFQYALFLGIHMAGPNLTPESFAAGMHAYPGGRGPAGTWGYPKGEHTPYRDSREIWWDPDRISGQNNEPGAWVQLNGGARWTPRRPPSGPAGYFKEG